MLREPLDVDQPFQTWTTCNPIVSYTRNAFVQETREQKRSEKRGTWVTKEPIFVRITWSLLLMGPTTKFRIDKERNNLSKKHWNSVSSISIFSSILLKLSMKIFTKSFINFYYMRYVYNFTSIFLQLISKLIFADESPFFLCRLFCMLFENIQL